MNKNLLSVSVLALASLAFTNLNAATEAETAALLKGSKASTTTQKVTTKTVTKTETVKAAKPVAKKMSDVAAPAKATEEAKPVPCATPAEAPKPKCGLGVEISGESTYNVYNFKNKRREENGGKGFGWHTGAEDSTFNVEAAGKAPCDVAGGLEYSYLVRFAPDAEKGVNPVRENRLKLKSAGGTFMIGNHRGFADFGAVGPFNFLGATGGIFGNYKTVVNETTGSVIRNDLAGIAKDETKLTYATPRFWKVVQLGVSWTPDGNTRGEQKPRTHSPQNAAGTNILAGANIWEGGFNLKHKFEMGLDSAFSVTGITGRTRDDKRAVARGGGTPGPFNGHERLVDRRRIEAYAVGAVFEYKGISFGAEYLDNMKSGLQKVFTKQDAGKVISTGLGYKLDKNKYTFGYLHSKKKLGRLTDTTNKLAAGANTVFDFGSVKSDVFSLTYDRQIACGLKWFISGTHMKSKASNQAQLGKWAIATNTSDTGVNTPNNKAHVIESGFGINF